MKKSLSLIIIMLVELVCRGTGLPRADTVIYLFPGQGADYRQFRDLEVPPGYDTVHITYPVPDKRETLPEYALRFFPLIDTDAPFVLLGVSLGGMICTELADTLDPERNRSAYP